MPYKAISSKDLTRIETHYSGHVQGVGFRYSTQRLASEFAVTGFVKNLSDGRVQVIVEGTQNECQRFLSTLQDEMSQYIHQVHSNTGPSNGEFATFEIRA